MDPSGTFVQCDARAIGSASEGAQSSLQEVYHKVQTTADLCLTGTLPLVCFLQHVLLSNVNQPGLKSYLFFVPPSLLSVHDIKRRHQVLSHHSEAGDGGEAQRHQHRGLFLGSHPLSDSIPEFHADFPNPCFLL